MEWSYRRVVILFYSFSHLFIDSLTFIHDYEPYSFVPERIDKSEVAKSYTKTVRTTFDRLKSIGIFFYSRNQFYELFFYRLCSISLNPSQSADVPLMSIPPYFILREDQESPPHPSLLPPRHLSHQPACKLLS